MMFLKIRESGGYMTKYSLAARLFRWGIRTWYARQGWTEERMIPVERKFVVIAAPHTSNWDFPYFLGLAQQLDLPLSFMGKKSLFRWPFAGVMKELGGIPVDRSKSVNMVDQMIAEFKKRDTFMLTIAPEGTRGKVREWKTGFYHIAMGAGVPLVCGLMDYKRKRGGLGPAIWPTGDYEKDMAKVAEYYRSCTPRHPEKGNVEMLRSG
jgi:1-acyl-sn-glycerol-3-phosphate acyltransferase